MRSLLLINQSLSVCLAAHPKASLVQRPRPPSLGLRPIHLEGGGCPKGRRRDCPCRDAAVKYNLITTVCRSPTGYFLLVEKVTKAPPRGKPLGYPRFKTSELLSVFGTRVSNGRIICLARPLLRWKNQLLPFLRSALCCNVLEVTTPARHTKGKLQCFIAILMSGSGANAAPIRQASADSCAGNLVRVKRRIPKGEPP